MNIRKGVASLFVGCLAQVAVAQTTLTVPTVSLQTLQNSFGVNAHLNYTDGMYANSADVMKDLAYLGISNVRDSLPNPGYDAPNADSIRSAVAAGGIHFDFLTTCTQTVATEKAGWDEYATKYPGSVLSIEGTNEINNAPCPGSGSNQANAVAFQRSIYSAVHADPNLKNVSVLDFTGGTAETGSLAGQADVLNTHPYPSPGQQPYARLKSDFNAVYGSNYGKLPSQITETGYQNLFFDPNLDGMDQLSVGEFAGNALFDSVLQGNTHTYLYQLLQAYPNNQTNGDTAYGMFDYFDQPTDLALFLHNVHVMLPTDVQTAVSPAQVTILGGALPSTAHLLATTTSSTYKGCPQCVVVWSWNEAPEYNTTTHENDIVYPETADVQMPGYAAVGYIFPAYSTIGGVTTDGTYNGKPKYKAALWGFPTGLVFKPVN